MTSQQRFIQNEIWVVTAQAGLQRSKTYADHATDKEKEAFRNAMKDWLDDIIKQKYQEKPVKSDQHIENIQLFCNNITEGFNNILINNKFRIGSAQKIFNLYLKYRWCLGDVQEPPHCPFDGIVIAKLGRECEHIKWTEMDDIEVYKYLVECAMTQANGTSLANWEIELWENRNK